MAGFVERQALQNIVRADRLGEAYLGLNNTDRQLSASEATIDILGVTQGHIRMIVKVPVHLPDGTTVMAYSALWKVRLPDPSQMTDKPRTCKVCGALAPLTSLYCKYCSTPYPAEGFYLAEAQGA
jgi:hypothetical protein